MMGMPMHGSAVVERGLATLDEWIGDHPPSPSSWAAVDVETANRSRGSICSVGIVLVESGEIVGGTRIAVRPDPLLFDAYNTFIHGISAEDVEGAPPFRDVWPDIARLIFGRTVLAHNAGFDMGAFRSALSEADIEFHEFSYYCTRVLSKKAWPGLSSYSLEALTGYCGLEEFIHHDALADAFACASLALACCEALGSTSLDDLADLHMFRRGRVFPGGYVSSGVRHKGKASIDSSKGFTSHSEVDTSHPFFDRVVVFTGTLQSMVRAEAIQLVVDVGGACASSVSRNTSYVVVGDQDYSRFRDGLMSSKMRKATELLADGVDIEIIGEADFIRLVHPG